MTANPTIYRCPDERQPISREIHLARLAMFYPKCPRCAHCHDTGALSRGRLQSLAKVRQRASRPPVFKSEGVGGVYLNDFGPDDARKAAAAYGIWLRRRREPDHTTTNAALSVVLAGDGRSTSCDLFAAASSGLRWSGCRVIDIGQATSPALVAYAQANEAAGALLVGNASGRPDTAELKFWNELGCPLSLNGDLNEIAHLLVRGLDRPVRCYGELAHGSAIRQYLMGLAEYFHALRPLRLVIDTSCRMLIDYLRGLTVNVACEVILSPAGGAAAASRMADRIAAEHAHFGMSIDGDGEACRLFDERGRPVASEQLLLLLARHVLHEKPSGAVVLEDDVPETIAQAIVRQGSQVVRAGASRSSIHRAMRAAGAVLGGGPSGRFWFTDESAAPIADALHALALLLNVLSLGDRPLSELVATA